MGGAAASGVSPQTIARINRRIVPFLFVLYVVNFLDRVNVGFAALQMNQQLGFGPEVYGFGAGIFFIGYIMLEVPSNIIMQRVGARIWLSRIMVSWGLVAMAAALTYDRTSFFLLRFLLGVAEAGFVPGIVLYLATWYPARERARAIAAVWTATAVAVVVGAPISALVMMMDGALGLPGWKWIFILEGMPAVLLGLVSFRYLTDTPAEAHWLDAAERGALATQLERERQEAGAHGFADLLPCLRNPAVWAFSALYFCVGIGFFGVTLWLPQIVKQLSGLSNVEVSLITTIPFALAAVSMVLNARHSDRTGERRWHLALPLLLGAVGLAGSGLATSPTLAFAMICVAAIGMWSSIGVFWSVPTAFLTGTAAAGGLALINSIGGLAGFVGPYLVGLIRSVMPSFSAALLGMSASLCFAVLLASVLPQTGRRARPPARDPSLSSAL